MDPVRYRILGTTQAFRGDGTPLTVGGARLRALLTVLALRPGRALPAALLVDEVWGADPPADATGALQALVGRLRRVLGADAIGSTEGGYRLRAAADDVDLHRFERLAGEGTRALGDGDPAKAAVILDDALALWHGPALADLPDHTAEPARWETRRLDARRARFGAALALGQAEQVLPDLTALCDAHPLDEALQLLRLRSLREAGRTAEALAAYEDVRQLLADRLGADPGPELRALHAELLRQGDEGRGDGGRADEGRTDEGRTDEGQGGGGSRPGVRGSDFEVPGPGIGSRDPGVGVRDPGVGLRGPGGFPELARSGRESADAGRQGERPDGLRGTGTPAGPGALSPQPQPPPQPSPPGNLRARLTSFVGRHSDLETIRKDLAAARLVTLLGPGGAGKTRLSQEAGESVAQSVPHGVWLAELAPVDDPATVPEAVLTAVGARETVLRGAGAEEMRVVAERHDDPLVRLAEHCAKRRMLLILDNCEHVVEAAAHLVEALLERCPGLTVLATSREPLGVPGELLRPVEPLPEPSALRLLADRGAAARPGFRIDDDPEAAAEICRRLDGLPLAIELAAARLRMLTPRQIADRLDDRFRLLTSGSRTVLPRQQTLRAVVDWSWDLLDEEERDVLRRLSVFAGGCDLAAAEAVCGPPALEALGSLVDKSLVVAVPSADGEMRYRLLETVAEYAGERLDEAGGRPDAERAHLTYYRELARTTDPELRGPGQRAAIERLELEGENLRAALQHAVAVRDEQEALCLIHSLFWYWQIRDLRLATRNWSREVMSLGPDPFRAPAEPAAPLYEPCIAEPPPMRPEVLAEARRGAHLIHLACMDLDLESWQTPQAEAKLRTITEVYRPGLPQTCRGPGYLWFYAVMLTGDMDRLRTNIDATVTTCRELGYTWELAVSLQMRANILANRADWAGDATRDADEALEIFTRIEDAWGAAEALSARGEAHERKGEYVLAAQDYTEAITHAERLGARSQTAVLSTRLGTVFIEDGQAERGEQLLRGVLEQGHGTVNEAMPAARLFLAMWLGRSGRTVEAREQMDRLRAEFGAVHFVVFDGFILGVESWLYSIEGRHEEAVVKARGALRQADDHISRMIAPYMPSIQLTVAALALAGLGGGRQARDAARCLGAADKLRPPAHHLTGAERETRAQAETAVRAVLDDAAYEAAYAEGGGLSFEEAAALV
ncbi:AfsR/SARP family transcriptional regulator [Streptomyces sporangiiformans]|uniref:AfsR/SARP family transcriptional regulator n=1 Tax=Streptomyces sporangiiformans TaxID=2315329 RepID=A0A505D3V6_9ACTN|nr:BTAD domain-containing putative transcriptional regulator [Streptomyces sporangiiformans]TPQ19163.1 AfsR/SARP family transcriptional regulator [Streptomyces sporangiiformans]